MRLAHASATWLVAGSLSLTGWAGPMPPYQTQAVVSVDPNQASRSEMEVELAWLADPVCFPCQLSAIHSGAVLEVGGAVPNDKVRQHVLAIAQKHSTLTVEDKLTVQPGSTFPVASSNRDMLCRTAVTRMAKHFGQHGLTFDITADEAGQLKVAGSIPTAEEKLEVSRRLSQLPGCSAVINRLDVNPLAKNFRRPPAEQPVAAAPAPRSQPVETAPVVTQVTLAAPKPISPKQQPRPQAQAAPVKPQPVAQAPSQAPVSPYAQTSKPVQAALGSPQPTTTPNQGWGQAASVNAKPQPTQQPQRTGSGQATAGTPSNQPTASPVATAGTPSAGPRPAAMPNAVANSAQPLPTQRSFVPNRPSTPPKDAKSEVVSANLKAPAYATPRSNVVPTGYQDDLGMPSSQWPMPHEVARPLPAAPAAAPTAPKPQAAPQPQPAQPVAAKPAQQPTAQPVAAKPQPQSQPAAQPVAAKPVQQPVAQPAAPKLRPTMPAAAPAVAKANEPISPYASRQVQPVAKPATPVTPEVRPASAYQPAPAARPEAPKPMPASQPAPRPMPVNTPTSAPVAQTAPANMPTSSPVGARPMPTERMTGRPTSPDITPSFMNYIKQRVTQVSGGQARDVELQKVGPDRLRIALVVNSPQEGEQVASKILAITELGPFQVDVEVRLAK